MKGTRPLDNDEIRRVSTCFTGTFEIRNRGLFMLGVSTGGRISELLSLRIGDVYQNKKPVSDLLYSKSIVKGGEVSRSVPVNADGRRSIDELVNWHRAHYRSVASKRPLFPSRHKSGTVPMHRQTAHAILKTAFIEAGLNGHIATHSTTKIVCTAVVYDNTGRHLHGAGVARSSEHLDNSEIPGCQLCGCQSRRRVNSVNDRV